MYFYILWDTCKLAFQLSVFTTLNKVLYCIVLLSWLSLLVFYHFCIVDIYVYFSVAVFVVVLVVLLLLLSLLLLLLLLLALLSLPLPMLLLSMLSLL